MINNVFFDLWLTCLCMICLRVLGTNLVNTKPTRKSARIFVSREELAINYTRCCTLALCLLISSFIPNSGLDKTSFFICFKYFFAPSIDA